MPETTIGQKIQALHLRGGAKPGTLLSLDAETAEQLQENGVIFTPTINMIDDDSTRNGPAEFLRRGYQRPAEAARVKKIASYYLTQDFLHFTTPIIAAVRKGLNGETLTSLLAKAVEGDDTALAALQRVIAIIDGQHRFEGAMGAVRQARAKGQTFRLDIVLILIHDLDYTGETELFNIINTTPKRLPKALVEWNRFGITSDGAVNHDQDIRQIAVTLATDPDSAWFNQVNLTGTGREPGRPVTLEGLRRSTDNMLKAGGLKYLKFDRQMELVKGYWAAVAETFPDAWNDVQPVVQMPDGTMAEAGSEVEVDGEKIKIPRITYRIKELVGVASLAKVGGDILAEALGSAEPIQYVQDEVEKLAEVDWEKSDHNPWVRSQAGFAGQKELYEALAYLRSNGVAPWDDGVELRAAESEDDYREDE